MCRWRKCKRIRPRTLWDETIGLFCCFFPNWIRTPSTNFASILLVFSYHVIRTNWSERFKVQVEDDNQADRLGRVYSGSGFLPPSLSCLWHNGQASHSRKDHQIHRNNWAYSCYQGGYNGTLRQCWLGSRNGHGTRMVWLQTNGAASKQHARFCSFADRQCRNVHFSTPRWRWHCTGDQGKCGLPGYSILGRYY